MSVVDYHSISATMALFIAMCFDQMPSHLSFWNPVWPNISLSWSEKTLPLPCQVILPTSTKYEISLIWIQVDPPHQSVGGGVEDESKYSLSILMYISPQNNLPQVC